MSNLKSRVFSSALIVITLAFSAASAFAQSTTSSIRGKVLDANGAPISNVEVVVTDQRTGASRRVKSNNSGTFFASNLTVGGPFLVEAEGQQSVKVDNISLGDVYSLTLGAANVAVDSAVEEVVVTGKAVGLADVAAGPSAVFSLRDLETAVAFNRDIKDVFSNDPRINLDNAGRGAAVNCGGKNPRFNSISVDGVAQNDRFGLNENGFATANGQPFPFDAIAQIAVELAPFEATAGGFSACSINSVTKSGRNEFFGNLFYEFGSDSLRGDTITVEGQDINIGGDQDFDSYKAGFTLGGPIIQDKLFFFVAYEDAEDPRFVAQGFNGSGNGIERDWLSEADFNRIRNIARDVYGYEPGDQPTDGTNTQEKILARIDWDINDQHRASFVYNKYDGVERRASDGDLDEFEFSNHFYDKGSELETIILKLNSQWTDALSSEIFISRNDLDDSQVTVGDPAFGDFQISIGRNTVYLGADDSRQANDLNYSSDLFKFNIQYLTGNHIISGGLEYDQLDVFNLFVQHSRGGEYDFFDDSFDGGLSGIDRFEQGLPSRIFYGSGGGTNIAEDASATFQPSKTSVYIQDEYIFDNIDLTVVAGLRYERFGEDNRPTFNAAFTEANGIRNDANVDGVDILMPRLGFTWNAQDNLTVRGGLGLFSGGNPNVWISNSFSNDGITNVQLRQSFDDSIFNLPLSGQGRPGFDVPQALVDGVAGTTAADAATSRLVLVDPNYEQPSELKFAIGATYDLTDTITLDADLLYTQQRDSAIYRDLSQQIVGQTLAGSPILAATNGSQNYLLTNSDRDADALVLSLGVKTQLSDSVDFNVGYAYSDAEDIAGMNSSVAFSNFVNVATNNPNDFQAGTSEYNTPHRLTMRLNFEKELFAGLATRLSVYGQFSEGQASSFTMSSAGLEADGFLSRQLLYVPTANDNAVVFGDGFDQAAFNQFIADRGLARGQFVSRNDFQSRFSSRVDIRVDQDLPEIAGFKPTLFFKMNNFLNFINDDWGEQFDAPFVRSQVVESSVNGAGQLVFEEFSNPDSSELLNDSVWQARIGVEVKF